MAYTENLEYILSELSLLGLSNLKDRIESEQEEIMFDCETKAGLNRIRHLSYSLLYCLGKKEEYRIYTRTKYGNKMMIKRVSSLGKIKEITGQQFNTVMTVVSDQDYNIMPNPDQEELDAIDSAAHFAQHGVTEEERAEGEKEWTRLTEIRKQRLGIE